MKRVALVLSLAAVVGLVAVATGVAAERKSKKEAAKDIVDTAVAAGDFKTLAAALKAADLVETLKGKGPFTVFAPTDEAFAKLPECAIHLVRRERHLGCARAELPSNPTSVFPKATAAFGSAA